MPRLPGISQARAVHAFERAGFRVERQSGHVIMSRGIGLPLVIPRPTQINAVTMAKIVRAAGLTIDEFKALL